MAVLSSAINSQHGVNPATYMWSIWIDLGDQTPSEVILFKAHGNSLFIKSSSTRSSCVQMLQTKSRGININWPAQWQQLINSSQNVPNKSRYSKCTISNLKHTSWLVLQSGLKVPIPCHMIFSSFALGWWHILFLLMQHRFFLLWNSYT